MLPANLPDRLCCFISLGVVCMVFCVETLNKAGRERSLARREKVSMPTSAMPRLILCVRVWFGKFVRIALLYTSIGGLKNLFGVPMAEMRVTQIIFPFRLKKI